MFVHAALDAMFTLIVRLHGVSRPDAVALASVVVHLRVTQIVNELIGAHAVLPGEALTAPGGEGRARRPGRLPPRSW